MMLMHHVFIYFNFIYEALSTVDFWCYVRFCYTEKWISYTYVYSFLDSFPDREICAVQNVFLVIYLLVTYVLAFYHSMHMSIPISQFIPPPHSSGLPWWLRWWKICLQTFRPRVRSLGQEDPLEKGMSTHSNILAWRIPWTEEHGGLQSMGSQRIRSDWAVEHFPFLLVTMNFFCCFRYLWFCFYFVTRFICTIYFRVHV